MQSTLQRLFARLDADRLIDALSAHFQPGATPDPQARGGQGVASDGKAQRGRLRFQADGSLVHARTAFCHDQGVVLAQAPIDSAADEAEAELTAAPALLARVDWRGRVLTGDALFFQRKRCRQVRDAGGDYLLVLREQQLSLLADLALLFDPPSGVVPPSLGDRREVATLERGHGRTDDRRHLVASTDRNAYLDWPDVAHVFRLVRLARVSGLTSVAAEVAHRLLWGEGRPGAHTPGALFGPELAEAVGGAFLIDQDRGSSERGEETHQVRRVGVR